MTEPNTPPPQPIQPPATSPIEPPPPRRGRRGLRIFIFIVLALIILLGAVVLLGPTIASTGAVRSIVVGKINDNLNGKVQIASWSLGWTSGIDVQDVKVFDDQQRLILQLGRLHTDLKLLDAVKGHIALGNTVIDDPNLVQLEIDDQGHTNFEKLAKSTPSAAPSTPKSEPAAKEPSAPSKLPDVSGDIKINNLSATVVLLPGPNQPVAPPPLYLKSGSAGIQIKSLNDPITETVKLPFAVGNGAPGTISLAGTVHAIENNQVLTDPNKIQADQQLDIVNVNLDALAPLLKLAHQEIQLGGMSNGSLAIKANGATDANIAGQFTVDNLTVSGAPLKGGDTFKTTKLTIPIKITRAPSGATTTFTIQSFGIQMPELTVDSHGQLSEAALNHLAAKQMPGDDGQLVVSVTAPNLATLANQLPKTLNLGPDVQIQNGKYSQVTTITLAKDKVVAQEQLDLTNVAGRNNGANISLDPVDLSANATLTNLENLLPGLRDLALVLKSGFASVQAGGPSLAKVNLNGDFDLAKLKQQAGQFVDLKAYDLAGSGKFSVASDGDLDAFRAGTAPIKTSTSVSLTGVSVRGIAAMSIDEPDLSLTTAGDVQGSAKQAGLDSIKNLKLYLSAKNLTVSRTGPAAGSTPIVQGKTVEAQVQGDLDLGAQLGAKLSAFGLNVPDVVSVAKDPARDFVAQIHPDKTFAGNGAISITANLRNLTDLGQAFAGQTEPNKLQSGVLQGNLSFDHGSAATTDVKADLNMTGLNVQSYLTNETVKVTLTSTIPDKLDQLSADAAINSSFANLTASKLQVLLKNADGSAVSPLAMVQNAAVKIDAPDLAKLDALLNALSPPATQPAAAPGAVAAAPPPPLQVLSGAANIDLAVTGGKNQTVVNLNQLQISKLSLQRGPATFTPDHDMTLKLVATATAAPNTATTAPVMQQLASVTIDQLSGDLAVAQISMPQPIKLTNLTSDISANGAIQVTGQIENISSLLNVLQGATNAFPYKGNYTLTENVGKAGDAIRLAGGLKAANFQVLQNGQPAFTEPSLELSNDVSVDSKQNIATISALSVNMTGSGALKVDVQGKITDWEKQRVFAGANNQQAFGLYLQYDLEKLWPIIRPLLSPDTQESLKDLKITGKQARGFNVSGSYPAGVPMNVAIKNLQANGGFAITSLNVKGMDIQNLAPPFQLKNGIVTLTSTDKSGAQIAVTPAQLNGGTLDLASTVIDLTDTDPRLSIAANHKLMANVALNQVFAANVNKIVPLFDDTDKAAGKMDLTVVQCNRIPLSDLMTKANKMEKSSADFQVSLSDVKLGGPIIGGLASVTGGGLDQSLRGSVQNAHLQLSSGTATIQNFALTLGQQARQVFKLEGTVGLADNGKLNLTVTLAKDLIAKWSKQIQQYLPDGIALPIGGTRDHPNYGQIDKIIAKMATDAVGKQLLGNVTGGNKSSSTGGATSQPANSDDTLGGVLGGLLNNDKADKNKKKSKKNN